VIDAEDRQRDCSGYAVMLSNGEVLHVWPSIGLVVTELAGEPISAGLPVLGLQQLTLAPDTSWLIGRLVTRMLHRWRSR
jgi:hypothetical protein